MTQEVENGLDRPTQVKQKLLLLCGFFVLGFIVFAFLDYQTRELVRVHGPIHEQLVQAREVLMDISPSRLDLGEARLTVFRLLEASDRAQRDELIQYGKTLREDYEKAHEQWARALPDSPFKQKLIVEAHRPAVEYLDARDRQFIPALESGKRQAAKAVVDGIMRERFGEHRAAIGESIRLAQGILADANARATNLVAGRSAITTVFGIAILALCMLFAWLLSRSITNVLAGTVGSLSATSSEMASTIEEHERTAVNQSAAVHETTATMDELDASFNHTAALVRTAADKAQQSVELSEDGLRSVQQTLDGMGELKEKVGQIAEHILGLSQQTSQIGSITTLVSDLASQTNMLALNAAVEAARAGEHGRGFAVVAAEIRKLADESRKSAEQISALVAEIQQETNATVMVTEEGTKMVERSIHLAQDTASAFNSVTSASSTVSEATQQTLHTVPQQVTAVKQVLEAMDSLNAGAQEAASGISQTRAGADDIREVAGRLKSMI